MMWDVWMVDELGIARLFLKNVGESEWSILSSRKSLLFRVPSGFLLGLLRRVDDLIEVD